MRKSISVSPNNSLILVMDPEIGEIPVPESMDNSLIVSTESCIGIGTLCEFDGVTNIVLSNDAASMKPSLFQVFDGEVETPNGIISVQSVYLENYLEIEASKPVSRMQVWVNHNTEPDYIEIVVS